MNNERFKLVIKMKNFIFYLDDILVNYPKKEYVLKDAIMKDSLRVLELIYEANSSIDKNNYLDKISSKLSMLDFYFEKSYKNRYISKKVFDKVIFELTTIMKMLYGWIKYDRSKVWWCFKNLWKRDM